MREVQSATLRDGSKVRVGGQAKVMVEFWNLSRRFNVGEVVSVDSIRIRGKQVFLKTADGYWAKATECAKAE